MEIPFDAVQRGTYAHLNGQIGVLLVDMPENQAMPYASFGACWEDPADDLGDEIFVVSLQIDIWDVGTSRARVQTALNAIAHRLYGPEGGPENVAIDGYVVVDLVRGQSRIDVLEGNLIQGSTVAVFTLQAI